MARKKNNKNGVDLPSYKYMECRVLRHSWTRVLTTKEPVGGCYILATDCIRCGTEKTVNIEKRTGKIVKRSMSYPENYIINNNPYKPKDFRIVYGQSIAP